MNPRRTHHSNQVFELQGGTEDNYLWVQIDLDAGTISSVWVPTPEERQAIAAGANIELTVWGGQPPVAMRTTTAPLGKSPSLGRPPAPDGGKTYG